MRNRRFWDYFSKPAAKPIRPASSGVVIEGLEGRQLLSVSHHVAHAPKVSHHVAHVKVAHAHLTKAEKAAAKAAAKAAKLAASTAAITAAATTTTTTTTTTTSTSCGGGGDFGGNEQTILFSAAPAAVKTGLQTLAPSGVTIADSQSVEERTLASGAILYTVDITSTGSEIRLTVDATGAAANLPGFGDHQALLLSAVPAAVKTGLQALAPTGVTIADTQNVFQRTLSDGTVTYSVVLTATGTRSVLTVDATGAAITPPGPTNVTTILFGAAPAAVKTSLQSQAPVGITIPDSQSVKQITRWDGSITYTTDVVSAGVVTTIGTDASGATITLRHETDNDEQTLLFSATPTVVQTGLKALAPTGVTIAATEYVNVHTNSDGTMTYTVKLTATGKQTTLTVDATGAAVTPTGDGFGDHGGFGFGNGGGFGGHHGHGFGGFGHD